ncbi:pentapeptide repeat-containing protein [Streptomyces sp. R33]|uniref:Pentapeptide repeat-containing protein n=1 Tax=Streptomyces sp. R33 TaxID=3238629 RepID=A0AB39YJ72_9ACTN
MEKTVAVLASIGALILVGFTWKSITQVNSSQAIDREGHITDRYMAAVELLGNRDSEEVRLGGLYGLQRVMQDSSRDQPTVINVVSTFIRAHSPKPPEAKLRALPSDITAALAVLRTRDGRHDGDVHVDLHDTDLQSANLREAVLTRADLRNAFMFVADLSDADLGRARLDGAVLRNAKLFHARLGVADLSDADLSGARLGGADLSDAKLGRANLASAYLGDANLRSADLRSADLSAAYLGGVNLSGADLSRAKLGGADLRDANLRRADLTEATLVCADLRAAVLQGADIGKDQLMSARVNTDTALPASLAGDPELKKKAASQTWPDDCKWGARWGAR